MTFRRALALASLFGAAAGFAGPAAAQTFVPQPQTYLLTTDAVDARALWVQPAGLGRRHESSVSALLTVNRGTGSTRVGQYGASLVSGPLAFGWQHDRLGGSRKSDVLVLGLGGGTPAVAFGFDRRWYWGVGTTGTKQRDGSWDFGAHYAVSPRLSASIVWRDIGSPVVADTLINATLVPGAALELFRGRAHVGADWEIVTHDWSTGAIRVGATVALPAHLALGLRGEFSGSLHARGLAVALTWNGVSARASAFSASAATPDVDRVGLWAAAVSDIYRPRPRHFRG